MVSLPVCEFGGVNGMGVVIPRPLSVIMVALVGLQKSILLAAHL